MWNSECFVEVEVTDVGSDVAWVGEANLRVHVGAVHVDLAAVVMDNACDFDDAFFVNAMRRWISNHDTCQDVFELGSNRAQLFDVDVAVGVTARNHYFKTCHDGRCRVGTVCRRRNDHFFALEIAARLMVGFNDHEACVFTLGTRVRLQRNRRKTCGFAEVLG